MLPILIAVIAFVVVAATVFIIFSVVDQRNAQARLLRDRLEAVQKAADRSPTEDLALLRDEMLSEIPALDNLLRRSARINSLQTFLSQADMKIRAGNMLMLSLASGLVFAVIGGMLADPLPSQPWARWWGC